jgi:hypothetical protein
MATSNSSNDELLQSIFQMVESKGRAKERKKEAGDDCRPKGKGYF